VSTRRGKGEGLSRRRFVSLLAAGSAGAVAAPALAAVRTRRRPVQKPPAPPVADDAATRKEFERQRTQLLGALKAIRAFPLPPGGDLPVVFRPLRTPRGARRGGSGAGGGR
jgi:hypothetical protein